MLDALKGWESEWEQVFAYAGNKESPEYSLASAADVVTRVMGTPESCSTDPFAREDVASIFALSAGEPDEKSWLIAGQLKDDRWFYVEAGCDYTGWD